MGAAAKQRRLVPVPELRIVAFSLTANVRFDELTERLRANALAVDPQTVALLASRPRRGIYLVGLDAAAIAEATAIVEWSRGCEPQPGLVAVIANGGCAEREQALIAGFDDAVTEPVSARELVGRVRAMRQRLQRPPRASRVGFRGLILDLRERIAWLETGKGYSLTENETAVLRALIEARGGVITYAELFRAAWVRKSSDHAARDVQATIKRIRRKFGRMDAIEVVRDVGVRLAPP